MKFSIITIFPKALESYLNTSMLKRARGKKLITVDIIDFRKFTGDKHNTADDKPYGGGPGMVLKAEPILKAVSKIRRGKRTGIFIMSASGRKFTGRLAGNYAAKFDHIILIAGHYEGIDERVKKALRAVEISVGDYVLTGGELPAMIVVDAVSRKISGVLGRTESLEEKRYGIGVPVYTRPEVLIFKGKKYSVPKVLLSGNHKKIDEWRSKHIN